MMASAPTDHERPKVAVTDARPSSEIEADVERSMVILCLTAADAAGACVGPARDAFDANGIVRVVVIAGNGSTGASRGVATATGARVVCVVERGCGSALMGGIAAARGRYALMADPDKSCDFGVPMQDVHCGMRAFSSSWYRSRQWDE